MVELEEMAVKMAMAPMTKNGDEIPVSYFFRACDFLGLDLNSPFLFRRLLCFDRPCQLGCACVCGCVGEGGT